MKVFDNPNAVLKCKHIKCYIAVLGNIIAVSSEGNASKSAIERYNKELHEVISYFYKLGCFEPKVISQICHVNDPHNVTILKHQNNYHKVC
jgi:hypothetical protein